MAPENAIITMSPCPTKPDAILTAVDMALIIRWSVSAGHEAFMMQIEDSEKDYFRKGFESYEEA